MTQTFEDYLRNSLSDGITEHSLFVSLTTEDEIQVYVEGSPDFILTTTDELLLKPPDEEL